MSIKRHFSWMLFSRVVSMAAAMLIGSLVNRALGPSDRGVYAEMQTWVTMFSVLFGFSIDSAIYHSGNRQLYVLDDKSRFITILLTTLFYACIGLVMFSAFTYLFPGYFSEKARRYLLFMNLLLFCMMLALSLTVFLQSLGNIYYAGFISIAQNVIVAFIIAYIYFRNNLSLDNAFIASIVSQVLSIIMLAVYFGQSGFFSGVFSRSTSIQLLKNGLTLHVATIATFAYTKVNQLLVMKYSGAAEAGMFAVSLNLAFASMIIPGVLQTVLYSRIIHSEDTFEITIKSMKYNFFGWGTIVLLLVISAEPIIMLYAGIAFRNSVNTFRILMVAAWFLSMSALTAPYFVKAGFFRLMSLSAVLLGLISIVANYFLVQRYASFGAALATALTSFIGFIFVSLMLFAEFKKKVLI